jgi:HAE1 family hydrophobic/amphiphilic exporter-1
MHGLAKLCIKRPVFATMLILALVVSGIFTYFSLGVDRMPKIDAPMVTITVINPGASPEEVETEITKKIEDAVNSISGFRRAPKSRLFRKWIRMPRPCCRSPFQLPVPHAT